MPRAATGASAYFLVPTRTQCARSEIMAASSSEHSCDSVWLPWPRPSERKKWPISPTLVSPCETRGPYTPLYAVPVNERCTLLMPPAHTSQMDSSASVFMSAHCQHGNGWLVSAFA